MKPAMFQVEVRRHGERKCTVSTIVPEWLARSLVCDIFRSHPNSSLGERLDNGVTTYIVNVFTEGE